MSKGKYKRKRIRKQRRETLIRDVDLPKRVIKILEEQEILTLADLDDMSEETLRGIEGIGIKSMDSLQLIRKNGNDKIMRGGCAYF